MSFDRDSPLAVVVGPTATGKSGLALELAWRLGGEIVNADAMSLYRGMEIGTARTPPNQRRGIVHHQIDVLDVTEEASVAAYQRHARDDIGGVWRRGRQPLLVGGSGLYIRAVTDRIDFPGQDPALRARWEAAGERHGGPYLHAELAKRDPAAATTIEPNNVRRLVRALEVIDLTGRPFAAQLPPHSAWRPVKIIGLRRDLAELDQLINQRVAAMMRAGLLDEVARLAERGLRGGRTASRAIGYREGLAVLDGQLTAVQAEAAVALATRQLARRQLKWFRRDPRIRWLDASQPGLVERALDALDLADAEIAA
ncbi:MAG: tRNA (adenosine(37)-N6)-dimethylallyltransferase MiaA [Bifidobacteriaceae bacterium]|jgi:tRNA dimethylallyltransferase|nr:tRNA (adenosine(37)-N6)-dimethylallyltransferase MiaA [Bifidobacteriaceae bacterium]